jgi:hypothetical protein
MTITRANGFRNPHGHLSGGGCVRVLPPTYLPGDLAARFTLRGPFCGAV